MRETFWLSIIVPHYNTPHSLRTLLDSIGVHDEIQVIVIDDHSDRYRADFMKCRKEYSRVLFLETDPEKKGAGAARNVGLRHAKGKWLLFADADDFFLPGWYEIVNGYKDSEDDIIYFNPVGKKEDGSRSTRHLLYSKLIEEYLSRNYGGEERLRFRFSVPWSKLIRTETVLRNNIRFDELRYSNDVMFSAKIGYFSKEITADRRSIYCVVEHEGSLTNQNSSEVYLRRMKVLCEREQFLRSHLSRSSFNACWPVSCVFSTKDTLQAGYGMKTVLSLLCLFRKYRIPFFYLNLKMYLNKGKQWSP